MGKAATTLAIYRVDPGKADSARAWQAKFDEAAAAFAGFTESRLTEQTGPKAVWAASVTFTSERALRDWLDSPARAALVAEGAAAGVIDAVPPIVLVEDEAPPPGIAVFTHRVVPGREEAFRQREHDLNVAGDEFEGYLGSILLAPQSPDGLWMSVVRFVYDAHLAAWINSPRRAALLPELRGQLQEDFHQYTRNTPFGSIVRVGSSGTVVTPQWKTAMVVLLVLYPVVMLLSRFVGPLLSDTGADPGLALWISQVISMGILTYLCMPWATRAFSWWLDPLDGADVRTSIKGAVIIVLLYVATLVIFLSLKDLQFWDYS